MPYPTIISELQSEQDLWARKNFGIGRDEDDPLIGIMEELGELAHAHLKSKQGIRVNENHQDKKIDAVGDIFIYLMDYCNLCGISLENAIINTWKEVKARDWTKNKEDGRA